MLAAEEASAKRSEYTSDLESALEKVDKYKATSQMLQGKWSKQVWPNTPAAKHDPETGIERDELIRVAKASVTLPDSFVSTHRLQVEQGSC